MVFKAWTRHVLLPQSLIHLGNNRLVLNKTKFKANPKLISKRQQKYSVCPTTICIWYIWYLHMMDFKCRCNKDAMESTLQKFLFCKIYTVSDDTNISTKRWLRPTPRSQARDHSNCRILMKNSFYKYVRYLITISYKAIAE